MNTTKIIASLVVSIISTNSMNSMAGSRANFHQFDGYSGWHISANRLLNNQQSNNTIDFIEFSDTTIIVSYSINVARRDQHTKVTPYVGFGLGSALQFQFSNTRSEFSYKIKSDVSINQLINHGKQVYTFNTHAYAHPKEPLWSLNRITLNMAYTGYENTSKNMASIGLGYNFSSK